jgi:protein-S-isoprenylcysteine O-methyltransferase Ste14
MYVGLLLGVWATPDMTAGHALLAAGFTVYILLALGYEERDLAARFGGAYRSWRTTCPMTLQSPRAEPVPVVAARTRAPGACSHRRSR